MFEGSYKSLGGETAAITVKQLERGYVLFVNGFELPNVTDYEVVEVAGRSPRLRVELIATTCEYLPAQEVSEAR